MITVKWKLTPDEVEALVHCFSIGYGGAPDDYPLLKAADAMWQRISDICAGADVIQPVHPPFEASQIAEMQRRIRESLQASGVDEETIKQKIREWSPTQR